VSQTTGKWRKYPPEFRRAALERMKTCDNVSALARQLGIRRKWLYKWSEKERALYAAATSPATGESGQAAEARRPAPPPDTQLRKRVQELESMVARQSLEIDFFKGALQRIEQRRRKRAETTASASTNKSEA
jgi:transposase-like protein